ncbi:hypothetical protein [Microbacterium shaanxiense]
MNATLRWTLSGVLLLVAAGVASFLVGWFAPLALTVTGVTCLVVGATVGVRSRARQSRSD